MRNSERIDEFCKELAAQWHKVPDWRFGQLISNAFCAIDRDIFFIEDDETLEMIRNLFEE